MQMYLNKGKCLRKKIVQLPQDCFATPAWPPLHLVHQYGWRDVMWKHSLYVTNVKCVSLIQVEYAYWIFISLLLSKIGLWISHFRVTLCLCSKNDALVQNLSNEVEFICMKLNLQAGHIYKWIVSHEDSSWGKIQPENGLLINCIFNKAQEIGYSF